MEVWKSLNREDYPIIMDPYRSNATPGHQHDTRTQQTRVFNDSCRLHKSESSFHVDAARVWNAAPNEIRNAASQTTAKNAAHKLCKSLPIWCMTTLLTFPSETFGGVVIVKHGQSPLKGKKWRQSNQNWESYILQKTILSDAMHGCKKSPKSDCLIKWKKGK